MPKIILDVNETKESRSVGGLDLRISADEMSGTAALIALSEAYIQAYEGMIIEHDAKCVRTDCNYTLLFTPLYKAIMDTKRDYEKMVTKRIAEDNINQND